MSKIKLVQGEALETMDKMIKAGIKVGAIIADIPFGTIHCSWDSIIPFDAMWERLNKLIKPKGVVVLFGSEPFSSALRMSNIKNYKYDWKWYKDKGSNYVHAKYQPMKDYEDIMVFSEGGAAQGSKTPMLYNRQFTKGLPYDKGVGIHTQIPILSGGSKDNSKIILKNESGLRSPRSILKIKSSFKKGERIHPTQKPIELGEYLVKTYTNEGDLVLDFTMGSGFIPRACNNLNRDCIGIDNGFCDKEKSEYHNMPWAEVVKDLIRKDNKEIK